MKKLFPAALALVLLLTACTGPAAETPGPDPTPTTTLSPVYTDWSKLEPYRKAQPLYTRRYAAFTDTLIPAADYGPLLPFAGAQLAGTDEWSVYQGQHDTFSLYGLVTLEGEVVADPVFSSAFHLEERDNWGNVTYAPGVMLLGKLFYDAEGRPEERFALCKGDGSWCTDFIYQYDWETYMSCSFAQGIPLETVDGKLDFLDPITGKVLRSLDLAAQVKSDDFSLSYFTPDPKTGWTSVQLYVGWEGLGGHSTALLFDPQGNNVSVPPEVKWLGQYSDGLIPAGGPLDGEGTAYRYGYLNAAGQWVIQPVFADASPFAGGAAPVREGDGVYFIDPAGNRLTQNYASMPDRWGDCWYFTDNTILDQALRPLPDHPLADCAPVTFLEDGWAYGLRENEGLLVRGTEVHRFPLSLGSLYGVQGDRVLFVKDEENATLTDLEGSIIARWENYSSAYFSYDNITGEWVISAYHYDDSAYWTDYYGRNGELLVHAEGYDSLLGGLCYHSEDGLTTLTDRTGKVIFRWIYDPIID